MADEVKTTMGMTFKAWQAPNFATLSMPPGRKEDGLVALPTFPVEELTNEAIDALAAQWLDHLYAKAGRSSPFTRVGAGR